MGTRTMRFRRKAILYGCLTYFGASVAAVIPFVLFAFVTSSDRNALQTTVDSAGYRLTGLILSLVATAAGGYVAARMAWRAELMNAFGVGVFVTLLLILSQASQALVGNWPDLLDIVSIVLTIPAALGGGFLRVSQLEQSTATD